MAETMTSQQLAALLSSQAAQSPHEIQLSDQTLGVTGLSALIKTDLGRPDGVLLLIVDPATIPQNPPADGFTLNATVPAGADGFLNLDNRDAQIQFLVGTTINLSLTVDAAESDGGTVSWVFSDSFPQLAYMPYDLLTINSPELLFSTGASGTPAKGLNFDGQLALEGLFGAVATLIGASSTYTLTGAFNQVEGGLSFNLQADLGVPSMTLGGIITLNHLVAGVSLTPVKQGDSFQQVTQFYLGATVTFSNSQGTQLPLNVQAQMPVTNPSSALLTLSVTPFTGTPVKIAASPTGAVRSGGVATFTTSDPHGLAAGDYATIAFVEDGSFNGTFSVVSAPSATTFTCSQPNRPNATSGGGTVSSGINTSLAQLGSLVGGQTWDDFFSGPASGLQSYFETFGLLSYSTTFVLSSASISSITLSVGTLQPWPLWSDYTLTLSGTWNIIFLGNSSVSTLELDAVFSFGTINFEVTVTLPDLVITGEQSGGALTYSLDQLNQDLFEGKLALPPDLLTVSVADFNITIDVNNKLLTIGAVADLSIAPFGVPLLAIHDMSIGVTVDSSGQQTIYTGTMNGLVSVGTLTAQADVTITNNPKADCIFSMHLVNETIGKLINQLVHLIDPNFDVSFGSPWDALLDISLDTLVLNVTLPGAQSNTPQSVSLTYDANINLGFMQINKLGLKYAKSATGPGSTTIELSGTFLGVQFGTNESNPPLGWDVMNGAPPAVPGQGSSLFDLQYVGLGQHITFQGVDLPNMTAVMKALRESVIPAQPGQLPPFGQNSLAFSAESNWLVGAQFSIMDTIAISAIFNDPNMYGVLIAMYGEKAKIFAGLSFEILYRKVTDTIGVYHIELKLPNAMRYLQFGEVSITLPVVILDIYTNGNFKIDLGFPVGSDFSNSFALQIFPFVGYGGLYFALLDGATSTRVPQITNGTFSPVIEFGLALSIGVGKTINWSVISGGLTITVQGILQGVLGWFQPYEPASHAMYYWLQGSVAIVGKLYASIDFGIIKANIDLTAYASVTLTVQCYSPIFIELSVGVSIRISVKVVFFTIHLSFKATISASFTIGNTSQPPWQLASGSPSTGRTVTVNSFAAQPQPQLRGQQTLYTPHSMHAGYNRALRMAALTVSAPVTEWPAVCVFPQGKQTVGLWALPAFTKSETTANVADAVILLTAGNSINPGAASINDHQELAGAEPASAAFNLLMQAMLAWGIYVETNGGTSVTADQLADLQQQLKNEDVVEAAFNYTTLTNFLAANFTFDITTVTEWLITSTGAVRSGGVATITTATAHGFAAGNIVSISGVTDTTFDGQYTVASVPSATTFTYAQDGLADSSSGNGAADVTAGVALFPMVPAIKLTDTAGTSVDFSSFNSVDENYEEKIAAYFQLLQVQYQQQQQNSGVQAKDAAPAASMATVIFSYYFNMLMSSGVQAAVDLLANYPYTTTAPSSIEDVANAVGDTTLTSEPLRVVTSTQDQAVLNAGAVLDLPSVVYQIRANDTFASIAAAFQAEGAFNSGGQPYSTGDLFAANLDTLSIFNPGVGVQYSGLGYTTQAGDTLNLISSRLLLRAAGPATVNSVANLGSAVQALQQANPSITDPNAPINPATTPAVILASGGTYSVVAGDTLTLIAAYFLAIEQGTLDLNTFLNSLLAIPANKAFVGIDPNQALTAGAAMAMPPVTYGFQSTDTVNTVATTLIATAAIIETNLLAAPASPAVLAPQGVLSVPLQYQIQAADTFSGIASKFDLTLQTVADQAVVVPQGGQMPKVFAASQALTITDLASIGVETLMENLLNEAEWNNASGMVSRFMLSGLRLPDPNSSYFQSLTVQDLLNPTKLGAIETLPMYQLTGQQYPLGATVPSGYQITLTNNAGAPWLNFGGAASATFGLTASQQTLAGEIASTALQTNVETLTRLSLFQMVPPRLVLQNQIAWQAAVPPAGCLSSSSATGNPAIWLFPDSLVQQVEALTGPALYEVVVAKHSNPDQPVTADQADCYAWATIVDFNISLPTTDGEATSVSNAYVIEGADDTGASLLQQVYQYLAEQDGNQQAVLYLLYSPNPASANPSGLASDELNASATYVLKTNLSTLTHSGGTTLKALAAADPTQVYDASLSEPANFIALLWEASVTRSGGFYLNYVNQNGGAALPPSVFGNSSTATLSLLVVLNEQAANRDAAIQPFNNCVIVSGNVDTSSSSLFVQPATYTVAEGDTLTTALNSFNAAWGTKFQLQDIVTFNQNLPLLLEVGAEVTIPGAPNPYAIQYGDTLNTLIQKYNPPTVQNWLSVASNATTPILAAGSPMQFASGVLQPATSVPPGTVGFEMTRQNPDPNNAPYNDLSPAQVVGSLFNLVGFNIAGAGGFIESGAGLPTTPADSWQDQTDGLEQRDLGDSTDPNWYYQQTLAVYPFASTQYGSASAALPPVRSNPYNGVGYNASAKQINEVTLNLDVQDIYGNIQPLPGQFATLQVPVGYYDDIVSLGSWPSLAISYLVTGAQPNPAIAFQMTMQQSRYIPAPGAAVNSALSSIQADLISYQSIYYQLSQPDLSFWLQTSLDKNSMASLQSAYALAKTPFYAFGYGAYVYLAALATMQAAQLTSDGTANVAALTSQYGVTAAQLFTANQDTLYSTLFGAAMLAVPEMYSTVAGDTLSSVVAKWTQYDLTVDSLAAMNETTPLAPGTDLTTPERTVTVAVINTSTPPLTQSLNDLAQTAQASAVGIAEANAALTGILQPGATLAIGTQSYLVVAGDSFNSIAAVLGSTVADVASANQYLQGLFVSGATLTVNEAVAGAGDTLLTLATKFAVGDVSTLAAANADLQNLFSAGTQLQIGINAQAKPPQQTDTLSSFASSNTVTVDQLASANATSSTVFASGAPISIPGVVTNTSAQQFCTYTASAQDTLGGIAAKFNQQSATIAALNPDIPGLIAGGQSIKDTTSGKSVTTETGDSFDSIIARFQQQQSVTVTLAQLAADVAAQGGLLVTGGLWICPPMLGGANGQNSAGTLAGLAAAYNIADVATLATANAAAIGLLASGVQLNQWAVPITTNQYETFNSLVNRLAEAGINATVEDVANAVASQPNLIQPQANVVPVPPPSPVGNQAAINPQFPSSVFQIAVNVVTTRNSQWVDPDFTNAAAVSTSVYSVAPEPDPQGTNTNSPYSLTQFATDLQNALPGLQAATGDPIAVDDPMSASTIWGVNFGSGFGPKITYQFQGAQTQYFALPPLSTSLMGGPVNITPYVSGQTPPFSGAPKTQTFQAVDLDVWLNTFLQTVDLFLSPAYAVPAYAIDPADTVNVVEQKQVLAEALSARLQYVLQGRPAGSMQDAQGAMYQALLTELSSAFTIDTIVQVPVAVTITGAQPAAPPNLSGKIVMNDPDGTASAQSLPSTFSFSTAKAALSAPGSTATFLFSVKSPASHKEANLDLQYVVTELELPDPSSTIGDYEGSSWLQFILPLETANSNIGNVDIPVPLRSYPSPVTLATQTARQSVANPAAATDLLGWDFSFVYQHDDAEQDSPLAAVAFNTTSNTVLGGGKGGEANLTKIYAALAQFMAAYPALKNDLALLTQVAPGTTNATALAAVQAFSQLVNGVATAWRSVASAEIFVPEVETYCYQMVKEQTSGAEPMLDTLTLNSINVDTGGPQATKLWPSIIALYEGSAYPLPVDSTGQQTEATYSYPTGADAIPADTQLQQCFLFGPAIAPPNGTPAGATRAGGITTISTTVPHGLSAGDQVIISGVTDSSFNGLFTVAATPGATAFTYVQSAAPNASSGNGTASKLIAWGGSQSILPAGAPAGASRAGGVATLTTTAAHGLSAGDQVIVSGVTDNSFNGLFTVASVPNAVSFTYAQTGLPDASSGSGTVGGLLPVAATTLPAPQLFSFNDANILSWQNALAGVAITRNLSLIEGVATNPAFIYQTPLVNFTSRAIPSVFAGEDISIGSGAVTGIAAAFGAFLETLLTSRNQWTAGELLTVRLSAAYSYALAASAAGASSMTELSTLVPILLVPSCDFDPTSDWNAANASSFVSQVQAVIVNWQRANQPVTVGGSFVFDLTIYAAQGQMQPLIQATSLQYNLS